MPLAERIGIVGGHGWLGSAMARAAVAAGAVDPARLTLSGRARPRDGSVIAGAYPTTDNDALVARSDVVVLSVRPDQFRDIRLAARGKLVVSVMAGVPAATIAERTGAEAVVRAIPNAAAAIGRSFTPWHAGPAVSAQQRATVQAFFEACGEAAEVPRESDIDYCVGLTGSGAAFPALLAEALIAHAVAQGLPRPFAERAARGVVAGASQLFAEGGDTAGIVAEMIAYGGTTAAALGAMRAGGFERAVADGLAAASARAAALAD